MRVGRNKHGFTLAEVMLAFALLTTTILTLVALSLYAAKAGQKSTNAVDASQLTMTLLKRISHQAASDPAFWASDHQTTPYLTGKEKVGHTEFDYEVYSQTLTDNRSGSNLGGTGIGNRIKKMDVVVKWFGDDTRSDYGKRSVRDSCLVNESS